MPKMQAGTQFRKTGEPRLRLLGREPSMLPWAKRTDRAAVVDPVANRLAANQAEPHAACAESTLKLLSFNIQVGIDTNAYRQYFTKGWKHVLPHESRAKNLSRIADLVSAYDVVGLQEIDGGSIRSGFIYSSAEIGLNEVPEVSDPY